ncbi:MAG: transcription termination factor NusA [Sphaerochaetaceae bacterium]|nr:transcription termination factor NusA [Sphaerochaetaceae bacterium]
MSSELGEAIRSMVAEKGISQELVISTIEDILRAAYKRKFGTDENAVIEFNDDYSDVTLSARKTIVDDDDYYNEVTEIPMSDAEELHEGCEIGDELLVPISLQEFDRISVQSAKQRAHQSFRDIQKDTLYSEFKAKEGQMIIGYYQRESNGDIFVDLGTTEGILPRRNQSSREVYRKNDKIKCYVERVEKAERGVRVVLSRTSPELVRLLFEMEVPEIYDHSIEIYKIVREAGYRTKIAVYSHRDDIDPVGACVGLKGIRIQTIMREIEGEKIDILKYDPNPTTFIRNALSPAEVRNVIVVDKDTYHALAIVDENQLSLAIGKQGLNVRLANKLCDWLIDVKTEAQFSEMDIATDARERADALFSDDGYVEGSEAEPEVDEGEIQLSDLPIDKNLLNKLQFHDIYTVEEYVNLSEAEIRELGDITDDEIKQLHDILVQYVDIVEEEHVEEPEMQFTCPECGHPVTPEMQTCPNCGVGLSFEEVDYEE